MIFHENRLLADDSHEISYLLFFKNSKMPTVKLSSAAVVISALRVNTNSRRQFCILSLFSPCGSRWPIQISNHPVEEERAGSLTLNTYIFKASL